MRTQRLTVSIDIDKKRGKKLRQIAELLANNEVRPDCISGMAASSMPGLV